MILISIRGNVRGQYPSFENSPAYIDRALIKGYNVLIDVWLISNTIFLGEHAPHYPIHINFLLQRKANLWCRAKNTEAMQMLIAYGMHCLWYETEARTCVFTSDGYLFVSSINFPTSPRNVYLVRHLPTIQNLQRTTQTHNSIAGICTDYVDLLRQASMDLD